MAELSPTKRLGVSLAPKVIDALEWSVSAPVVGKPYADPYLIGDDGGAILAFWHNRLLLMAYAYWGKKKNNAMVSRHGDGELLVRFMEHFGFETIRGSTNTSNKDKGGAKALKQGVRVLRRGETVVITPDGPRGPVYQANIGVVALAQLAGVPVIPVGYACSAWWELRSWDRFRIPKPFSKGIYVIGKPYHVPRKANREELEWHRQQVEQKLFDANEDAAQLVGVPFHDRDQAAESR